MAARYDLHRGGTAQFHWDLRSANNERILSSELYNTKAAAEIGIRSCRANSGNDSRYVKLTSRDGKPYFVLKGANGEVIGASETYNSEAARDNGIAACKRDGPGAPTVDNT